MNYKNMTDDQLRAVLETVRQEFETRKHLPKARQMISLVKTFRVQLEKVEHILAKEPWFVTKLNAIGIEVFYDTLNTTLKEN